MQEKLIKSTEHFQELFSTYFQRMSALLVRTLLSVCVCPLYGLDNPNQIGDALGVVKGSLYRSLGALSLYYARRLCLRIGCAIGTVAIKSVEGQSASTQSRRRITVSVDDTNIACNGEQVSYCGQWWSKKHNGAIWCQNVLGIPLKVGARVYPLHLCLVSKRGRGNTDKPSLVIAMLKEVLSCLDAHGIDLRKYPITFDSRYGSRNLVQTLSELGFGSILIHGKSNYVMRIGGTTAKLSVHKQNIELHENQWVCDKPICRVKAESPTFGKCVVIFFSSG